MAKGGNALQDYGAGIKEFCQRTFGTTDLKECRMKMSEGYSGVWRE